MILMLVGEWHPGKTARWRKQKYFAQHNGQDRSFFGETWDDDGQPGATWLLRASNTAIKRHIKVQGDANPYDAAYETYFEREEAHMRESFRSTRIPRFLWYEQSGLCPVCYMKITQTTGWRLHYYVSRTMGGSTSADNEMRSCRGKCAGHCKSFLNKRVAPYRKRRIEGASLRKRLVTSTQVCGNKQKYQGQINDGLTKCMAGKPRFIDS